jgi:hypothetical protein
MRRQRIRLIGVGLMTVPILDMELAWQEGSAEVSNPTQARRGPPLAVDREKVRAWARQLVEAATAPESPPGPVITPDGRKLVTIQQSSGWDATYLNWACNEPPRSDGKWDLRFTGDGLHSWTRAVRLNRVGMAVAAQIARREASAAFIDEVRKELEKSADRVATAMARLEPNEPELAYFAIYNFAIHDFEKEFRPKHRKGDGAHRAPHRP